MNDNHDNQEQNSFENLFHQLDAPNKQNDMPDEPAQGASSSAENDAPADFTHISLAAQTADAIPPTPQTENGADGLMSLMKSRLCLWIAGLSAAIIAVETILSCISIGSLSSLNDGTLLAPALLYTILAVSAGLGLLNAGGWFQMYKKQTVSLHRGMTRTMAILYTVSYGITALILLLAIAMFGIAATSYAESSFDNIAPEMIPFVQSFASGIIIFMLLILALPGVIKWLVTCAAGNMRKRLLELPIRHRLAGAVKGFKMAEFVCYCIGFVIIGLYALLFGMMFSVVVTQTFPDTPEFSQSLSQISQAINIPLIIAGAAVYIAAAAETFLEYRFYKKAQALKL